MAKSNSEVHVGHRNNCNWQPNWTVDKTWPLQTCDDLNRIYQHAAINFVAKEDFLNPGLRGCAGVNYALLVRAPLERLVSHIQFAKFSPAHVDEWSRGGKATGNIAHESYTVFNDMSIRMLLGEEVYFSPFGSIDASHVEEAKRLLEGFALVLPTDQLDHPQLTRILHQTLGWAPDGVAKHANSRAKRPSRTVEQQLQQWPGLLERARNTTKEDQEVYAWARQRFLDTWGGKGAGAG